MRKVRMKSYLHGVILGCLVFSTSAWAEDQTIEIKEYKYVPEKVTVAAGTKVTWVNHDEIPHTIDDTNKLFRSAALDTDETYSFTFTKPGTYPYFCRLHSQMVGTVVVTEAK
jgi:plastocyanin